ncbi:MAG: hypothetical protein VX252_00405 [Myxococcota bacterium]|nr:hypothetical protein [Myxococcota bacterium]
MRQRRVAAIALPLFVFGLTWSAGALAAVPQRDRVESAIAKTNASAGRGQAMQIDLFVQIGDRPAVARGELLTDPSGLARLELRGAGDLVERHLLRNGRSQAARNGEAIAQPRPFLPPVFVLQASSGDGLRKALLGLQVDPGPLGLVECGEEDCLVLGDPDQDIPPPPGPALAGLEEYELEKAQAEEARRVEYEAVRVWFWAGADQLVFAGLSQEAESLRLEALAEEAEASGSVLDEGSVETLIAADWNEAAQEQSTLPALGEDQPQAGLTEGATSFGGALEEGPLLSPAPVFVVTPDLPRSASLWVSRENYEIRGLETASGTRVELGPLAAFGGVFLPAWIQIEEPGQEPIRLEIEAARRVEIQPDSFSEGWLMTPNQPPGGNEIETAPGL